MRGVEDWLQAYGESHRHPANERLHWVCVPLIMLSLVGLLWSLPVPRALAAAPLVNWGSAFVVAALVYYFVLSRPLALGMVIVSAAMLALLAWLDGFDTPLWVICAVVFALAWAGQFVGHAVEGKKPSFFEDVQFLMIGPLWILAGAYRRLGIRY